MWVLSTLFTLALLVFTAQATDPICPLQPTLPTSCNCIERQDLRIMVVTHGPLSEPFWEEVHQGVLAASNGLGIQVEHLAPTTTDLRSGLGMAGTLTALFDRVVAEAPDGVILSIPSTAMVDTALDQFHAAGITVMSINSGYETVETIAFAKRPVLHVGQDENAAGEEVATALYAAGVRRGFCINDEALTNAAKAVRCNAFQTKLVELGGTIVTGTYADAVATAFGTISSSSQSNALRDLLQNTDVDGLVTLSAEVAIQASTVIAAEDTTVKLATFDATEDVLTLLDAGTLVTAVDQQPFLQGFLPVLFMTTFKTSLMKAENSKLKSGPVLLSTRPAPTLFAAGSDVTLKAITHGSGGDNFWDVVYLGALQAADDMGITLDLSAMCDSGYAGNDPAVMAGLIDATLSQSDVPAGILVSIPNADVLNASLSAAVANNVAVVSLNSGYDSAGALGALLHVGQTEYEAGEMAGNFFINNGGTSGLCLNYEPDNAGMVQRCTGFRAALVAAGLPVIDQLITFDTDANIIAITPTLRDNPGIDSVLVCGQSAAAEAVAVVENVKTLAGHGSRTIMVGTFDYGPAVGTMITNNQLLFGIHQQQYYQGYVPVVILTLAQTRGLTLLEDILFTGPAFVTAAEVTPRECELAVTCTVTEVAQDTLVLRARIGSNVQALRYAPANFGMSQSEMAALYLSSDYVTIEIAPGRRRMQDTAAHDGCTSLTPASVAGSAVLINEGGCLFTTKVSNALAAGFGMAVIARTTAKPPVQMIGDNSTNALAAIGVFMISKVDGDVLRAATAPEVRVTPFSLTCPAGQREVNFECQACGEGTYQDAQGASSCISCPPGRFGDTTGVNSTDGCKLCPAGLYQDRAGAQDCKSCPDTSISPHSGSTSCDICPANNVTGVVVVTARTCGLTFSANGTVEDKCDRDELKTVATDCFCSTDYFGSPGQVCSACPDGAHCCSCPEMFDQTGSDKHNLASIFDSFQKYDRPCGTCTFGATEDPDSSPPMAKPGYFSSPHKQNTFLVCSPVEACTGGPQSTCSAGYTGHRCGQCDIGYYKDGGNCTECPTTPFWLMVLAGSLLVFFCLYTLNAVSRWFRSSALAIALDWAQTTSIIMSIQLGWPNEFKGLLQIFSALMFNAEIFAPECSMKTDYWATWGAQLLLPFIATGCFAAIYLVVWLRHKYLCPKITDEKQSWSTNHAAAVKHAFINAYFMFLSVFHPFLTKNTLEIFRCRTLADGKAYLDVEPSLQCYTDDWFQNVPIAVACFLIYGIGIPVLFFMVLYRGRDQIDTRNFKRKFGSIFIIYRKECWYWEVWIKSKKLLVCLTMNIFPEETTYQAIVSLIIIEVAIHMNMKKQPFRFPANNFTQKVASLNTLLVLFSGLMFYSEKLDKWAQDTLVAVCLFYTIATFVYLARAAVIETLAYYGAEMVQSKPKLKSCLDSQICRCFFKTQHLLSRSGHWAKTEDLLDKYSKASMILADTEDSAPPAQEVDMSAPKPVNNARGLRQFRRRSLVSLGDIGQAAVPDSSMLFGLFFRENESAATAIDNAKLL